MRTLCAALTLCAACSADRHFDGRPPVGPIAVGATLVGGAGSETCRHGERGSWCSTNTVEISSLAAEPAGLFELAKDAPGSFTVLALGAGKAKITFVASDGFETKTFAGETTAMAANKVSIAPINPRGQPCSEPLLYGTDLNVDLPFELYRDTTPLQGRGLYPFQATSVTINDSQAYDRKLSFRTPSSAMTASITSIADPTFTVPIQVFAPTDVQEIRISEPSEPLTAPYSFYDGAIVHIELVVGGRVTCDSRFPGTLSISSAEECLLSAGSTERLPTLPKSSGPITIYGVKAGTCTLTATLTGTSTTASKTFPVIKR